RLAARGTDGGAFRQQPPGLCLDLVRPGADVGGGRPAVGARGAAGGGNGAMMGTKGLSQVARILMGMDAAAEAPVSPDAAGRRNMLLLIQLRWLAVIGQVVTIVIVHWGLGISLPLGPLLLAPTALAVVNLVSAPVTLRPSGRAAGRGRGRPLGWW